MHTVLFTLQYPYICIKYIYTLHTFLVFSYTDYSNVLPTAHNNVYYTYFYNHMYAYCIIHVVVSIHSIYILHTFLVFSYTDYSNVLTY